MARPRRVFFLVLFLLFLRPLYSLCVRKTSFAAASRCANRFVALLLLFTVFGAPSKFNALVSSPGFGLRADMGWDAKQNKQTCLRREAHANVQTHAELVQGECN